VEEALLFLQKQAEQVEEVGGVAILQPIPQDLLLLPLLLEPVPG
jgi:hypothetical protein